MTVSAPRGIDTSMFFRLCCRAPTTWMQELRAIGISIRPSESGKRDREQAANASFFSTGKPIRLILMGFELKRTMRSKHGPKTEYGCRVSLVHCPANPWRLAPKMSENVDPAPEIREGEDRTHSGCLGNRQVEG